MVVFGNRCNWSILQNRWPIPEELWQLAKETYIDTFPELFGNNTNEEDVGSTPNNKKRDHL